MMQTSTEGPKCLGFLGLIGASLGFIRQAYVVLWGTMEHAASYRAL